MLRIAVVAHDGCHSCWISGDDNTAVREYLSTVAKEALSQYSSEETAWHNREVHRKKQAGFKWKEEFESLGVA